MILDGAVVRFLAVNFTRGLAAMRSHRPPRLCRRWVWAADCKLLEFLGEPFSCQVGENLEVPKPIPSTVPEVGMSRCQAFELIISPARSHLSQHQQNTFRPYSLLEHMIGCDS